MRHAEKSSGNELNEQGWQRARALPRYFEENSLLRSLGKPVAIYAASPKHEGSSIRPEQTVTPLAQALGISINLSFNFSQVRDLANQILGASAYDERMVVVCWVHKSINDLPAAFGVEMPSSPQWPDGRFDRLWIIRYDSSCRPQFSWTDEDLLPGDPSES